MTLHTDKSKAASAIPAADRAAKERLATCNKNQCPQCGDWLLAPEWSEYLSERCVRHTWSCDACGYAFESDVFFAAAA